MKKKLFTGIVAACLMLPSVSFADLDPRDYVGVPPGTFAMITYYRFISADKLYADDERIAKDAGLTANVGIFRPVYYGDVGGFLYNIQTLIIVGEQSLNGELGDTSASGFFDPVLLGTFWFINDNQNQTWLGITPYITVPIGEYNEKKALNTGENRWKFEPEIMLSKGFGNGWFLDVGGAVEFFTKNEDFLKDNDLEQDPLWTAELHLSKDITKKWYIGASYFYHFGGETEVNGDKQNDEQNNHTLMGTMVFGFDTNYNIQIQYLKDISVESGFERGAFQLRFLYFF